MNKKATKQKELPPRIKSELAVFPFIKSNGHFLTVKHCANLGDIIAVLPAVKKYSLETGVKIKFLQVVNFPGNYYQGAVHPTVSDSGEQVTMNHAMFQMIKPLLESQDYIHSCEIFSGQLVDLDFDVIRTKIFVGLPNLMIQSWVMFAYPDLALNLAKPWVTLPDVPNHPIKKKVKGKIIVNMTERYHSENIEYLFLREYAPELLFSGTEKEHSKFCDRWQLDIKRLEVNDFLEYAYALKYSKFILGNQSFGWNLAQAMGTPRLVELCRFAPNVQPYVGENSFGFFNQVGARWGFRELYKNT